MTSRRIACALALLGGMFSLTAQAQPVAREASAASAASREPSAEARRRSQDAPFAFRGIALGITLDEFRSGSTVRAAPVGSVPVCETDVQAGALGMRLKSRESLTVACRWAHRADDGWAVSQAVVDGAPDLVTHNVSASSTMPVYVWENAVSSITLCFLPGSRNGTLTYLLKGSDAWVKSVVRQWQASGAEAG